MLRGHWARISRSAVRVDLVRLVLGLPICSPQSFRIHPSSAALWVTVIAKYLIVLVKFTHRGNISLNPWAWRWTYSYREFECNHTPLFHKGICTTDDDMMISVSPCPDKSFYNGKTVAQCGSLRVTCSDLRAICFSATFNDELFPAFLLLLCSDTTVF